MIALIHKKQLLSFRHGGFSYSRLPGSSQWMRRSGRGVEFKVVAGNRPDVIAKGFGGEV